MKQSYAPRDTVYPKRNSPFKTNLLPSKEELNFLPDLIATQRYFVAALPCLSKMSKLISHPHGRCTLPVAQDVVHLTHEVQFPKDTCSSNVAGLSGYDILLE